MTGAGIDRLVDEVCDRAARIPGDVAAVVGDELDRLAPLVSTADRQLVVERAIARLDGLDILDHVVRDTDVDEVMVNRGREVWVDRSGSLDRLPDLQPGAVDVVLERVLAPLGRRLDRTTPIVDARLPVGAGVCGVV